MIGNSLEYFPVGRYEIRKFEGKKPVYKPVGEDATDALNALQKEKQLLAARHLLADVPIVQLVEERAGPFSASSCNASLPPPRIAARPLPLMPTNAAPRSFFW